MAISSVVIFVHFFCFRAHVVFPLIRRNFVLEWCEQSTVGPRHYTSRRQQSSCCCRHTQIDMTMKIIVREIWLCFAVLHTILFEFDIKSIRLMELFVRRVFAFFPSPFFQSSNSRKNSHLCAMNVAARRLNWFSFRFYSFSAIAQSDLRPAAQNGCVETEAENQLIFHAYNRFDLGISAHVSA